MLFVVVVAISKYLMYFETDSQIIFYVEHLLNTDLRATSTFSSDLFLGYLHVSLSIGIYFGIRVIFERG